MRLAEALDDMVDGRAPVTTDRGEHQPGWDSPGARPLDADMALDHIERAVAADGISMYLWLIDIGRGRGRRKW